MVLYPYVATLTFDGVNRAANAVGQIYAKSDPTFSAPLQAVNASGVAVELKSDSNALLPPFFVEGHTAIVWKSGVWEFPLVTSEPVPGQPGEQGVGIQNVSASGDQMTVNLTDGTELAPITLPTAPGGSNGGVAEYITTDGPTKTALSSTTARRTALNVELKGATGGNVVENTAFAAAMSDAIAARIPSPSTIYPDPLGQTVIEFGPGVYRITDPGGLMGAQDPGSKAVGLKFKGAGSTMTTVIFAPAVADTLLFNDFWLGLRFEGITFICETDGSTFMQSHTTHAAQDYMFTDVYFWGRWKHIVDLQGSNNNSEFRFFGCGSSLIQEGGAFLHVGATNTSDQFLNYWFFGHKHWSTNAPLIDMARGGHVHIFGLDASDCFGTITEPKYLFYLRGPSHALGVCTFNASGVRVEAKNALAGLLWSEWPQGNVTFTAADWTSQGNVYTYGDIITIKYANYGGAIYTFRDSNLVGGVNVAIKTADWSRDHSITFDSCTFTQRLTPSEVVTYDVSGAGGNNTYPKVQFTNCRGTNADVFSATGATVWDATMGTVRGETVMSTPKRELTVRGVYGLTVDGQVAKVNLPIGAIITGFRLIAPAGGTTEGNGGTWTLKTNEAVPVTVGEAVVAGALSAGFNQAASITTPYYCATREKATLTVSTTNVTTANSRGLAIIEGYW